MRKLQSGAGELGRGEIAKKVNEIRNFTHKCPLDAHDNRLFNMHSLILHTLILHI